MDAATWNERRPTETAVAKVLSDIPLALDEGGLACLALLDLSAAFDTVDHEVLLQTSHNLRCERCGARLVPFVLDRSPPICQSPSKPVVYGPHALRCSARIGSRPDLISIVHRWHRSISRESWTTCPPLCWRHSSVWILFTVVNWSITVKHVGLHWRCCWLDGVIGSS